MANQSPIIYLIDDDHIYHSIIDMLLERVPHPYVLRTFFNGQEAIDELLNQKNNVDELPNIILLDISMPIMNGWAFLEELKPLFASLARKPIISMMSSSSLDEDVSRALNYENVNEFITKPITIDHLEKLTSMV